MTMRKNGKLRLTLDHFRFLAQYAGAMFVALAYPRLPERVWLLPGVNGRREALFLWTALLLAVAIGFDRALERAAKQDADEIERHMHGGGLNRSTLLAVGVPLLFLLDVAAIAHVYAAYFKSGAPAPQADASVRTAVAAVGCVLFIYGRRLPHLRFGSVWGVRTKKTLASPDAWTAAHVKAAPGCLAGGALALAAGALLSGAAMALCGALGAAAAFAALALAGVSNQKKERNA